MKHPQYSDQGTATELKLTTYIRLGTILSVARSSVLDVIFYQKNLLPVNLVSEFFFSF